MPAKLPYWSSYWSGSVSYTHLPVKKEKFKSYEDLPLMLSVPEMATALGISRAGAYELARSEGFPALRIGTRIVIPKDELREWIKRAMGKQEIQ